MKTTMTYALYNGMTLLAIHADKHHWDDMTYVAMYPQLSVQPVRHMHQKSN